jgi:hypothetical protein
MRADFAAAQKLGEAQADLCHFGRGWGGDGPVHDATRALFAGIVEWCLLNGFTSNRGGHRPALRTDLALVAWLLL